MPDYIGNDWTSNVDDATQRNIGAGNTGSIRNTKAYTAGANERIGMVGVRGISPDANPVGVDIHLYEAVQNADTGTGWGPTGNSLASWSDLVLPGSGDSVSYAETSAAYSLTEGTTYMLIATKGATGTAGAPKIVNVIGATSAGPDNIYWEKTTGNSIPTYGDLSTNKLNQIDLQMGALIEATGLNTENCSSLVVGKS